MSNIDQEMWQDFVVEAEENMQELEPNLLLLEQDPSNISLLNDCFRNMHSIKGAANYMGLENTAKLSHRMETLFDRVRQGDINLAENAMNVLFDGIDRVKRLVREAAESHEEKSDIADILEMLDAVLAGENDEDTDSVSVGEPESAALDDSVGGEIEDGEDDAELLAIFVEELQSRMRQMEQLASNAPVERQVVEEMIRDMIRVTNYIGREELLNELETEKDAASSDNSEAGDLLGKEAINGLVQRLSELFSSHLGPDFSTPPDSAGEIGLAGEEDEELYSIFLEFVQEEGRPLADIPQEPDSEWLELCRMAVEKLTASAHYMDYHDVVSLLEEWDERLVEALSSMTEDKPFNGEPLRRLWARFCAMLPGLENYLGYAEGESGKPDDIVLENQSDTVSAEEGASDGTAEDDAFVAMDNLFDGMIPESGDSKTEYDSAGDGFPQGQKAFKGLDSALDSMFSDANGDGGGAQQTFQPAEDSVSDAHNFGLPAESADRPVASPDASARGGMAAGSKLVRVDLAKVEGLLEDVGELVVLRATMLQIADDMKELYSRWLEERRLSSAEIKPLKQIMIRTAEQTATLEKVVHQLQDGVMKMRMLPVGTLFKRYPRLIRDLSRKLDKKVELRVYGEGTALDKRVIEHITDPLQHIVRNAVDHGIENPDVREKQGKSATGTLTLSADQEGNFVVIKISDDGRGLDREAIIQKAVSNGIINGETARTMSDERVWNMIFLPGISTASSISDTSGRGVGMDVVKNNIERLGGQISVSSSPGRGTSITLRIPLTLAIIQTLLVRVGDQNMAVPLSAVQETFRIYDDEISSIEGFEIISLRQETLPLIRLGHVFRGTGAEENPEKLFIVRVKMQDMEAGLAVDRFVGQQEVVIKPLADYLTDQPGFSGATILGDGTVALILDIPAVLERARNFTLKRQQIMEQAALGIAGGEAVQTMH